MISLTTPANGVLPICCHQLMQQVLQKFRSAPFKGRHLLLGGNETRHDPLLDHRLEQSFLAVEIQVKRSFGYAGVRGHVVEPCRSEAFLNEEFKRGRRQFGKDAPPCGAGVGALDNSTGLFSVEIDCFIMHRY